MSIRIFPLADAVGGTTLVSSWGLQPWWSTVTSTLSVGPGFSGLNVRVAAWETRAAKNSIHIREMTLRSIRSLLVKERLAIKAYHSSGYDRQPEERRPDLMAFTEDECRRCRKDFPSLARTVDGHPLAFLDGPAGT